MFSVASVRRQCESSCLCCVTLCGAAADDYTRDPEGKMVIMDEDAIARAKALKRKRRGDDDFDSDDSDFEDLRGVGGLDLAVREANKSSAVQKAMADAKSVGGRSAGAKSAGGKSLGGKSGAAKSEGGRSTASNGRKGPSLHSGERWVLA